jgi:hypothetical protein
MKEYQAVMLRLTHHPRDDEDALTDLLNERSRTGWEPTLMTQTPTGAMPGARAGGERLTVIFSRETTSD